MQHTFDEWKAKGYHVIKGQKATGRNKDGKATFSRGQVEENYDHISMLYDERFVDKFNAALEREEIKPYGH